MVELLQYLSLTNGIISNFWIRCFLFNLLYRNFFASLLIFTFVNISLPSSAYFFPDDIMVKNRPHLFVILQSRILMAYIETNSLYKSLRLSAIFLETLLFNLSHLNQLLFFADHAFHFLLYQIC